MTSPAPQRSHRVSSLIPSGAVGPPCCAVLVIQRFWWLPTPRQVRNPVGTSLSPTHKTLQDIGVWGGNPTLVKRDKPAKIQPRRSPCLLQPGRHKHLSGCIFAVLSPQSTEGTRGWEHPLLVALQYPTKGSSHHPKTPLSPSAPHNRQPRRALNLHRTLHPCLSPGWRPPQPSTPLGGHNRATRFGKPFFREEPVKARNPCRK